MKLQSGIDADSRYDKRRVEISKLFLPMVKITLRHLAKISEEQNESEKFPSFTSQSSKFWTFLAKNCVLF